MMTNEAAQDAQASPLVSVALCVYNGERFLREQLDSVLAQIGARLEVVALDDASSDPSVALLQEYAACDPRVRVLRNPENLGPTRSFERALAECHGDLLAPCDQDDIWHPQKLSRLLAAIGDADLAYCDSEYIDDEGQPAGRRVSADLGPMMEGAEPLRFVFANTVSGHASLIRRRVFEAARPFPAAVFHDWWLTLCAAAGNGVVYLDEPLVQFRRHERAFSTIGRDRKGRRPPGRYRAWLEQRRGLLRAHAASTMREHARAAALCDALERAMADRARWPLLRELWRQRTFAPGERSPAANAIRLQLRFLRKLRRARNENVRA